VFLLDYVFAGFVRALLILIGIFAGTGCVLALGRLLVCWLAGV
jgi:hypothetical protein